MIKSIPSVWDETIVLPASEPGELAAFAQRKGTTWFLSILNGLQPKTVKIPLTFLSKESYNTYTLNDNSENPAAVIVSEAIAEQNKIVTIKLGEGGGFITRYSIK
jgi:alpha-glucosidase